MPEQIREQIFGAELSAVRAAANSVASSARSSVATFKPRVDQTDFDVIIAGAGLSGIGVAYHPQRDCPRKSFVILEVRGEKAIADGLIPPRVGGVFDRPQGAR